MGAITHNGEVLQSLPANASQINFDKTGTDLNSTQVENAIKEVNTKANTNANDIYQLKSGLTGKQNKDYTLVGTIDVSGTINLSGYKEVFFQPQGGAYVSPVMPIINGASCRYYVDAENYISITIDTNNIATLSANSAWANNCGVYAR